MFKDYAEIYVRSGDGGNGAVSFRREKYVSHGGPDGGDGGRGGNIVFKATGEINTLLPFKYKKKFVAENGGAGAGSKYHGKNGKDTVVEVPYGTVVREKKSGKILTDMSGDEPYVCCRGGNGGWGNRHFATPSRQVPNFAKAGLEGEEKELILELKILADVGLIGYPNAGKSSILARISAARPKIADYRFTTLAPNLGVADAGDNSTFVVADIPGLIDGAAEGAGLGHEFLRHTERCRLLLHVVDVAGTEGRNPVEDISNISAELEKYSPELAKKPRIIVANKIDVLDRELTDIEKFETYVKEKNFGLIYVSAATGENMKELVRLCRDRLRSLPPVKIYESEVVETADAKDEETKVYEKNGGYVVEGEWIRRLMREINFDDRESLNYFHRVIKKRGVYDMLAEKGCGEGDTVYIYNFEFEYIP